MRLDGLHNALLIREGAQKVLGDLANHQADIIASAVLEDISRMELESGEVVPFIAGMTFATESVIVAIARLADLGWPIGPAVGAICESNLRAVKQVYLSQEVQP